MYIRLTISFFLIFFFFFLVYEVGRQGANDMQMIELNKVHAYRYKSISNTNQKQNEYEGKIRNDKID